MRGSRCKCPNCNVPSKKFQKLFISIEDDVIATDLDDVSLSSTEEEADGSEEAQEGSQEECQEESLSNNNNNNMITIDLDDDADNDAENDENTVQVVDLTMTPSPARAPPTTATSHSQSQGKNDDEKYKKIAKKFKRLYRQSQSQKEEQYQNFKDVTQKLQTVTNEKDELGSSIREFERRLHYQQLDLEQQRLSNVKLSTHLKEQDRKFADITSALKTARDQYSNLQGSYQKDMKKAHASSTAEVKELAARTYELERERMTLNDTIARYEQMLGGKKRLVLSTSTNVDKKATKKKKQRDVAKALRGMDSARTIATDPIFAGVENQQQRQQIDNSKYSLNAARLLAAGNKKRRKPSSGLGAAATGILSDPPINKKKKQRPASTSLNLGSGRSSSSGGGANRKRPSANLQPSRPYADRRPASTLWGTNASNTH